MLAATLQASGVDLPVRIRNMSSRGAMVDGSYLPEPEASVLLSRLALKVAAADHVFVCDVVCYCNFLVAK